MKRLALFFLMLTASIGWAVAQNRTITGTVTSGEGKEPVMFANVVVEGNTSIGTTTDVDGKFTLSVPASAKKLTFSYVGLKTVTLPITKVMNVVMTADSQVLDQVIVVGYGSGQKLSTISGSMARVSGEQIAEKPVANVMDALQGKVAGMSVLTTSGDPNAVAKVQIHGTGSLTAGSAPLYIVDGMQTDLGTVMAMNSNDIESLTTLMDASSTSIYGARAANGVIVITTKKGKRSEEGFGHITVNAQYGISQFINRKPYDNMMTGDELLQYQASHGYLKTKNKNQLLMKLNELATKASSETEAWPFNPLENNDVKNYNADNYNFDWLKFFMGRNAPTYNADISFSGGSNRTQYYISMGTFSQEGLTRGRNSFTRYNGRISVDSRVKEWLKVGANIFGAYTQQYASSFEGGAYVNEGPYGALSQPRYLSPYDKNGELRRYWYLVQLGKSTVDRVIKDKYIRNLSDGYQANIGGYAELTPIKGLVIKTQAGLDLSHSFTSKSFLPGAYWETDQRGSRSERRSLSNLFTWTNTAEYRTTFADKHKLTFLLGQEWVQSRADIIAAYANGFEHRSFMLLGNGSTQPEDLILPDQAKSGYNYLSFFGRVNYSFDNYLHLDLSLRSDASSRFGANNQTALFYSVGATYDLYRAHLEHIKWLNTLRLRASWGTTGNSSIPTLAFYPHLGRVNYSGDFGLYAAAIGNPDLGWERQSNLNIGVDFDAFDNRLHTVANVYHRITDNMLMQVPLPYISGFASRYENVGSMTNTGIDLTASYDIVRTRDWNVYVSAVLNYNHERISKIFYGMDEYKMPSYSLVYKVGEAEQFLMAEYAGVNPKTGKQRWYVPDENGNISPDRITEEYVAEKLLRASGKKLRAPFNGGFSMGASWKGLALDIDWSFNVGKWVMNNDRYFTENLSFDNLSDNKSRKVLEAWTLKNRNTDVPKFGEKVAFDSRFLENASFLRLKSARLSYALPSEWFKKVGLITGVRVYVTGRNLLTITKFTGFDPEAVLNMAMNSYPNTRQYVGGIQITF